MSVVFIPIAKQSAGAYTRYKIHHSACGDTSMRKTSILNKNKGTRSVALISVGATVRAEIGEDFLAYDY